MELSVEIDEQDWARFAKHIDKKLRRMVRKKRRPTDSLFEVLVYFIYTVTVLSLFDQDLPFSWPTAAAVAVFFVLFFVNLLRDAVKVKKASAPAPDGSLLGTHHYLFDQDGIHSRGRGYRAHHQWGCIREIERATGLIIVYLDTTLAFIFPEKKLQDADGLYRYLLELHKHSHAE